VILGVANRLIENCEHLLAWEEEVRFTILPDQVSQIGETLRGTTKQIVAELNTLADRLEEPFGNRNPEGTYNIQLVFKEPENIAKLTAQIAELTVRVENDPLAWNDWFS